MRLGLGSRLVPLVAACTLTVAVLLAACEAGRQTDLNLLCLFSLFAYTVVYHLAYDLVILIIPLFYVLSRMQCGTRLMSSIVSGQSCSQSSSAGPGSRTILFQTMKTQDSTSVCCRKTKRRRGVVGWVGNTTHTRYAVSSSFGQDGPRTRSSRGGLRA